MTINLMDIKNLKSDKLYHKKAYKFLFIMPVDLMER